MNPTPASKILILRANCPNDFSGVSYITAEFDADFPARLRELQAQVDRLFKLFPTTYYGSLEINASALGMHLQAYQCTTGLEEILSAAGKDWGVADAVPVDSEEWPTSCHYLSVGKGGDLWVKLSAKHTGDVAEAEIASDMIAVVLNQSTRA